MKNSVAATNWTRDVKNQFASGLGKIALLFKSLEFGHEGITCPRWDPRVRYCRAGMISREIFPKEALKNVALGQ